MGINTASCSDVNGSQEFKCQCEDGFDGQRCEVAVCSSNYCYNNGLCSIEDDNGIKSLQCECFDGFEGQRCDINLCDSVICENGSCDAGNCICDDGFVDIQNNCKQTCNLNPCEVLFFTESIKTKNIILIKTSMVFPSKTNISQIMKYILRSSLRTLVLILTTVLT